MVTGCAHDQITHPFTQVIFPDQSAGADVSGLDNFVTSIAGDTSPTTVVPDELTDESAYSIGIRVQVIDSIEAIQAETILSQAGAKIITQAD